MSQNNQITPLKPCPFCGKTSAFAIAESKVTGCFQFTCGEHLGGCGASAGFCESRKEAENKWNHRTESESQKLILEQITMQQKLILERQGKLALCLYEIGNENLSPEMMTPQTKETLLFIQSLLPK